MKEHIPELIPPSRLMMTPGPSSVDPRVYRAMTAPIVGHLDPWFNDVLIPDLQGLLRKAFRTENRITFPISASGSGGIEATVFNVLEPGDEAIVCVNGTFSERMAIISERTGAKVIRVEVPLGRPVDAEDVRRAVKGHKIKMVGLTHGETSTGVVHNLDHFRKVADECGALLCVDAVATLCGVKLEADRQRLDICFSGSQKAISAPPGMAPITVSARAEEAIRARKVPVQSWYFDLNNTMTMWGKERSYHHTPPVSLIYALREALRLVFEEGLEERWTRHIQSQHSLVAGLEAMGLEMLVANPADRLPTVTAVKVPAGVDDVKIRRQLLDEFGIEIAGGFGPLKGKMWRVGLMGWVSRINNVLLLLSALEKLLLDNGYPVPAGAGAAAAIRVYARAEAASVRA